MEESEKHLAHLAEIKDIMQRSSQFISLSGLSGISAGMAALVGAFFAYRELGSANGRSWTISEATVWPLVYIALAVFVVASILAIYFTKRKADKAGEKLWNRTSKKVLFNLMLPMFTGGIFCLGLIYHGYYPLVAPATMLFYGLACLNGSHFTISDIRYLGISMIVLGLVNLFYLGYGLVFWTLGFGLLHIIYGSRMYFKYDHKKA